MDHGAAAGLAESGGVDPVAAAGLATDATTALVPLLGPAAALVEAFLEHFRKSTQGSESDIVSWSCTPDLAFRRVTSKEPFLEGFATHYGTEYMLAERDAIDAELSQSPFHELAIRTMLTFHGSRFTEEDRARCVTKNPGANFFMLCEDEDIATGDDGQMDGDMMIRSSCSSWRLIALNTLDASFVEYSGESWSGDVVGIGVLYAFAAANSDPVVDPGLTTGPGLEVGDSCETTVVYTFDGVERQPSPGQKDRMDVLSGLVESFAQSLDLNQ